MSPATSAPLYFHHNASCEHPWVAWPSFSSAEGFVPFLFGIDDSSGFHFAPEHIYLLFYHIGCLWLSDPLRTSILRSGSLPEFLIVSVIPRLDACSRSSHFCHNASQNSPRATRHLLSSAALFVSLQFRQNPYSGFPCAPELSYLIHCHLGCLHSVARPPGTSVCCWITLWSFASYLRAAFCLFCSRHPSPTIIVLHKAILAPHSLPLAL